MSLSKKLISHVEPEAIVVVNALPAKVFEEELKDRFPPAWNDKYGRHVTVLGHRPIPVFLASMLTRQRAMDKGAYRRLRWHIRKVIEQMGNAHTRGGS
jgi:hypothetical protein